MKRANTRIGDVFSVKMDNNKKKYLQYVISDLTQLNSDVIRVFKTEYPDDKNPNLLEIVNGVYYPEKSLLVGQVNSCLYRKLVYKFHTKL